MNVFICHPCYLSIFWFMSLAAVPCTYPHLGKEGTVVVCQDCTTEGLLQITIHHISTASMNEPTIQNSFLIVTEIGQHMTNV